jgi:hemin uptake protein HemP
MTTSPSSKPPLRIAEFRSPGGQDSAAGPAIPLLRSRDLFGRAREILIEHDGSYYRLRLTHSNKLILTK